MCQCQSATSEVVRPSIRYSVQERGEAEAQRHKWIESEKAGRDLGNWAILCWIRYHWNGFLRERWLEHLQGRTYWYELDRDDYGLLQRAFQDSDLIDEILDRLKSGAGEPRRPELGHRHRPAHGRSPRDPREARHQ